MEAPLDFKSRRALRNMKLMNQRQDECRKSFHVHFPQNSGQQAKNKFKNAANIVMNAKLFEQAAREIFDGTIDETDSDGIWVCKKEAGVTFWTNKTTGEVRSQAPLQREKTAVLPSRPLFSLSRRGMRANTSRNLVATTQSPQKRASAVFFEDLGDGTGSLVYEDQEMKEFWELLDQGTTNK